MLVISSKKRVPLSKPQQLSIFRRERWLCHWCGKAVIFAPVMKYIELEVRSAGFTGPVAYYHAHSTRATSPLLDELGGVLDHVKAFALGGQCDPENFVTSCAKCNGRKGSSTVDDWGQRPKRKPIKSRYGEPDDWDGLSMLFAVLAQRHREVLSAGERAWLVAIHASLADTPQLSSEV